MSFPAPDGPFLPHIEDASDVRKIPMDKLPVLAKEIRDRVVEVAYKNGGHFGANLGVVELSIALHYVYDFSNDYLVWDVGHQVYPHKLLTGRNKTFDSLRQYKGMAGFPHPRESKYDLFHTGHAGTAISTAWGLALGAQQAGENRKAVAVVGDAGIAEGLPFEAMFHIGHLQKDFLIILNDNRMSIAQSVGSLVKYLNKIRLRPGYHEFRNAVYNTLEKIPLVGRGMRKGVDYLNDCMRHTIQPGQLFEELGLKYFGPIDGHDLHQLITHLDKMRMLPGPKLLHVITEKGKGYKSAEENPYKYHAVKPKTPEASAAPGKPAEQSYTQVFSDAIVEAAKANPKVVGITAAMPDGTGIDKLIEECPAQAFDVGICEQHAVAMASGMARAGLRPVVAIYSTFLQRAFDQVHQEVCLQNLPVIFAVDRGGLVGNDGPTHHGAFDIAYLRALPNMTLMAPRSGAELKAMLQFAIHYTTGPVAIRYPRGNTNVVVGEVAPIMRGKGEVLVKGKDIALLGYGHMVDTALQAHAKLAARDIYPTVVNPRFAKPLDEALILELARTHSVLITLEDGTVNGGFGSAVMQFLNEQPDSGLARVIVRGLPDRYVDHGSIGELHKEVGLDAASIAQLVESVFEKTHTAR